jgi:23S rRNA (adenine2030-N6)-methyltransferase
MLSYRHGFHAGNFADVFKHALLTQLLLAMQRKDKGFLYLDTHAGAGRYDLHSDYAQKLKEYESGIGLLWQADDLPAGLKPYRDAVAAMNRGPGLRFYPGSPALALALGRPQDQLIFCELHPTDSEALRRFCPKQRGLRVERRDGLQALKAFLPPLLGRGLVHIDPPYERDQEYRQLPELLQMARKRFPAGVFALWYPLLSSRESQRLGERMAATGMRNIQRFELWRQVPGPGLYGCGMLVFNPPWRLDEEFGASLAWLADRLGAKGAGWRSDWLVPE